MPMQIVRSSDCGNSPKNQLLEELAIAIACGNGESIDQYVSDEVEWRAVGGVTTRGKPALIDALTRQRPSRPRRVEVTHVSSHGKVGSVNGAIGFSGSKQREFCHVFEFVNAKGTTVGRITSYVIDF